MEIHSALRTCCRPSIETTGMLCLEPDCPELSAAQDCPACSEALACAASSTAPDCPSSSTVPDCLAFYEEPEPELLLGGAGLSCF